MLATACMSHSYIRVQETPRAATRSTTLNDSSEKGHEMPPAACRRRIASGPRAGPQLGTASLEAVQGADEGADAY